MRYYSYTEFIKDCKNLTKQLYSYEIDTIVAIARGGVTLGHFLSSGLDIRELYTINSIHYDGTTKLDHFIISNIPDLSKSSKVLIVDDIVDSGETMKEILDILSKQYPQCSFTTLSLFYKNTAVMQPDITLYEAKEWIDFFWEKV